MKDKSTVVDGVKTYYWEGPSTPLRTGGKGETILFLHGWGGRSNGTLTLLEKNFHVVAPFFPGHGVTEPMPVRHTLDNYADFIMKFIRKLGLPPLHLIGHSMGSLVALRLALKQPAKFKKLILIGYSDDYLEDQPPERRLAAAPLLALTASEPSRNALAKFAETKTGKALLATTFNRICRMEGRKQPTIRREAESYKGTNGEALVESLADVLCDTQGKKLDGLRLPTALIYGREEQLVSPKKRKEICEGNPQLKRIEISNAGHLTMADNPEALAQAIRAFLI